MAAAFDFQAPWSIHFGNGQARQCGRVLPQDNRSTTVVLISDPGVMEVGHSATVADGLRSDGFAVSMFSALQGDPNTATIDAAAAFIRENMPLGVVGLGGGSALDVAKLGTVLASSSLTSQQVALGAVDLPVKATKLILIPTTAGTGAEVTRTVV